MAGSAAPRSLRSSGAEDAPIKELSNGKSETITDVEATAPKAAALPADAPTPKKELGRLDLDASTTCEKGSSLTEEQKPGVSDSPQTDGKTGNGRVIAPAEDNSLFRLTETQKQVLRNARQRAKEASDAAFPDLAHWLRGAGVHARRARARLAVHPGERADRRPLQPYKNVWMAIDGARGFPKGHPLPQPV